MCINAQLCMDVCVYVNGYTVYCTCRYVYSCVMFCSCSASSRSKGAIDLEHFCNVAQLDAEKTEEKLMQR